MTYAASHRRRQHQHRARRVRRRRARRRAGGCRRCASGRPTRSGCSSTACSRTSSIDRVEIDGVIIGSVVPPLTPHHAGDGRALLRRDAARSSIRRSNTGMPILYEQPGRSRRRSHRQRRRGVRAYGARRGVPLIVVDFGTATTFDAVTAKGEYLGGVICPGVADLGRRAVSARGAAAARRRAQAGDASSAGRRSARWSRACSTATSGWSRGWCAG